MAVIVKVNRYTFRRNNSLKSVFAMFGTESEESLFLMGADSFILDPFSEANWCAGKLVGCYMVNVLKF